MMAWREIDMLVSSTIRAFVLASLVALVVAGGAPAEDRAGALLAKKLAEFPGAERGQVLPVNDPSVNAVFPQEHFYVLRFRQYPVAIDPPEPLEANNLFVVKRDDSVERLHGAEDLERVFRAALPPVTAPAQAKDATRAWLRLVEERHQDGFFQFSIPEDSLRVAGEPGGTLRSTGKATVTRQAGNAGEITASLAFDQSGRLVKASEAAKLKSGMRPICQATKLLDPDPIVRRMAEQDLLVMGASAREYLEEQRANADPQLRSAIDRIRERILREDR
jgi:hypothetical protein